MERHNSEEMEQGVYQVHLPFLPERRNHIHTFKAVGRIHFTHARLSDIYPALVNFFNGELVGALQVTTDGDKSIFCALVFEKEDWCEIAVYLREQEPLLNCVCAFKLMNGSEEAFGNVQRHVERWLSSSFMTTTPVSGASSPDSNLDGDLPGNLFQALGHSVISLQASCAIALARMVSANEAAALSLDPAKLTRSYEHLFHQGASFLSKYFAARSLRCILVTPSDDKSFLNAVVVYRVVYSAITITPAEYNNGLAAASIAECATIVTRMGASLLNMRATVRLVHLIEEACTREPSSRSRIYLDDMLCEMRMHLNSCVI